MIKTFVLAALLSTTAAFAQTPVAKSAAPIVAAPAAVAVPAAQTKPVAAAKKHHGKRHHAKKMAKAPATK